jgi:8-oxo-dGTP diphosphatase
MPLQFPIVVWGDHRVTFRSWSACTPPNGVYRAALVFAFHNDRVVLAQIPGRGWCVPSGRLEPGESAVEAARREAREEAGLSLGTLNPIGDTVFQTNDGTDPTLAANFVAEVNRFDPIPPLSESLGIRLSSREELSTCYYLWDELVKSIFDYAWDQRS